jgi:two-component system, cell cycle sensor histidine kinase and response regulator CckA
MNIDTPGDPDGAQLRRRVEFIAHDLRHLTTIILGYNTLLLERTPQSDPNRRDLEHIQFAADRVASLVRELQDFRQERTTPPSIVDLNALIRRTEALLRGVLGEAVFLETRLCAKLGRIKANPEQIDRVLINLAMNARQALDSGGAVNIATRNVKLDAREYVEVQFTDDGRGMDVQAESGSGLGLSIVREIVQQAGGGISIRSAPAAGTTVTIVFPKFERVVLVAEDDPQMRELVRTMLAEAGYTVAEAANGEQALAILAGGGIDLMLVDILMPQQDGLECIRIARKSYREVKIVAMSGAREDYLGVASLLGAQAVVGKPFKRDFLLGIVGRLLA